MSQKAEGSEPVVHADDHDATSREIRRLVERLRIGAEGVTTPVNPNHDRQLFGRAVGGSPDVEVKAILAGLGAETHARERVQKWTDDLRGRRSELRAFADS